MYPKNLIFRPKDWAQMFVNAYCSSYEKVLIGIARLREHDVYTNHEQKTTELFNRAIFKLNVYPEITYEELISKAKEDRVDFIYLHLREVGDYTLSFCLYDVAKNEVSCKCTDEREAVLALRAYMELNRI